MNLNNFHIKFKIIFILKFFLFLFMRFNIRQGKNFLNKMKIYVRYKDVVLNKYENMNERDLT